MAHDVFISHSTKDKKLADAICAGLEARGIRCWIAPRDIIPGVNYAGQIFKAISTGKIFLIIITENSTISTHVLKEVEIAIQSGSAVLPFRTEDVPLSDDLKYYLSNVHWLDALTPPVERHIFHLGDFIFRLLDKPESGKPVEEELGVQKTDQVKPSSVEEVKPSKAATESSRKIPEEKIPAKPPELKTAKPKVKPSPKIKHLGRIIGIATAGCALIATSVIGYFSGWFTPITTPSSTPTQPLPTLASYDPVISKVSSTDGATMVYVPEGEFLMGSQQGVGNPSEYPQHSVYLSGFWIDQTEVTNAMYEKCVEQGGCSEPGEPDLLILGEYPAVNVTYDQAFEYCQWAGKGLPTEAQWEKAARGTDARQYPWGNEFDCAKGNFDVPGCDIHTSTAPVGSFSAGASPYGVLDMAGNVWEWVADWYDSYSTEMTSDPAGPESGEKVIFRGGSWKSSGDNARTAVRTAVFLGHNDNTIGFRCATTNDPETLSIGNAGAIDTRVDAYGMTMVLIPTSTFTMGSPVDEGGENEMPQHEVELTEYWIDQTEVTNHMYRMCVEEGACSPPGDPGEDSPDVYFTDEEWSDHPVNKVDWDQASTFCSWAGKRLPTEAEWELAARGIDFQYYPWGYDEPDYSPLDLVNFEGTTAVGSFPRGASPFGALDMAGNVSEWVADWYDQYEDGYQVNPTGPTEGVERVIRGGSWRDEAGQLHSTFRTSRSPDIREDTLGFRCVLPTQDIASWIESIITIVNNQPPDFEDDFSQVDPNWQVADNPSGEYIPENASLEISDGVLRLSLANAQGGVLSYPDMVFANYALQLDINFFNAPVGIEFRMWSESGTQPNFTIGNDGYWRFEQSVENTPEYFEDGVIPQERVPDFSQPITITIINISPNFIVMLDGSPFYTYDEQNSEGPFILDFVFGSGVNLKQNYVVEIDNFKIWNLDN
jgi:formylglycine-generating enzyme required for sulfatase activity